MLKMMGLDPEKLDEIASGILAKVETRIGEEFGRLHDRFTSLETNLADAMRLNANLAARAASLENHVAALQTKVQTDVSGALGAIGSVVAGTLATSAVAGALSPDAGAQVDGAKAGE